ncbi:uncharacterized protein PHALS_12472 [Plasmopara halstedii]|uniref:Uncharacterized protein n=1 Tax=Plasmopara halstedii TaxID=4781 RepID=A0A0P1AM23_PLAHL|nr:uncharacterized protein PHALS_12472 [Plasmopara halstedii]CEG42177.1 hypothetical protein PHALS_12472 [Plasmopara halstedii]|eukprot:XP_024578546.1 hypothetical protein PHALS_12472 [Plasmopara halstedii]
MVYVPLVLAKVSTLILKPSSKGNNVDVDDQQIQQIWAGAIILLVNDVEDRITHARYLQGQGWYFFVSPIVYKIHMSMFGRPKRQNTLTMNTTADFKSDELLHCTEIDHFGKTRC